MILLDCDGVLADFVGAIRSRLESRGLPIEEDQIRHLDLSKSLSKEQMRIVDQAAIDPAFCFQIQPYPYAKELMDWVRTQEYAIVTSPWTPPGWCDERMDWLKWYFQVPRERVIFAHGSMKRHVQGDIVVEDSIQNLRAWAYNNEDPNSKAVLVKRPWNREGNTKWWDVSPENLLATLKGLVQ